LGCDVSTPILYTLDSWGFLSGFFSALLYGYTRNIWQKIIDKWTRNEAGEEEWLMVGQYQ